MDGIAFLPIWMDRMDEADETKKSHIKDDENFLFSKLFKLFT